MAIEAGALVEVVTASGKTARMRAVGAPSEGRDFPVLWVCTEEEFEQAGPDGHVEGIPWPLDAVREVVDHAHV